MPTVGFLTRATMTNQRPSLPGCLLAVAAFFILFAVIAPTSFLVGAMLERNGTLPGSTADQINEGPPQYQILWQAREIIQNHYVDRTAIEEQRLAYGAISGMVEALGDTGHSRFLSPEMMQAESQALSGDFEGIGAELTTKDGMPVVVSPMENSPAERAGIRAGDVIVAVDGEDTTGMALSNIIQRVRGPKGTTVVLSVLHEGDNQVTDIPIVRAKIPLINVSAHMIPGTQVLLVRIGSFSERVSDDLKTALQQGKVDGAQKIILDLRNSPGGLLDEAIAVASQFLGDGLVMQEQDAQGNRKPLAVKPGGVALDMPLVVLINQGTASAAEIVSGALQDQGRGQLIGQTTFGTGTVLNQFELDDGSALLLATRQWLTPNGRVIWHQGIEPDITVVLPMDVMLITPSRLRTMTPEEFQAAQDVQLQRALETLDKAPNTAHR